MNLSPTEKLRRFLTLEINRNCDNRAVVGGLKKYLPNWQREAGTVGIDPDLTEKISVFLNTYEEKDTDERKTAIMEIIRILPAPTPNEIHRPERPTRVREPRETREQKEAREIKQERPAARFRKNTVMSETAEIQTQPVQEKRRERREPVVQADKQDAPRNPVSVPEKTLVEVSVETPVIPESELSASPRRISHNRDEQTTRISSNEELRRSFGRSVIDANGPSVDSPVSKIPGIGFSNSKALAKQNVYTVRDFLYYFPRRYDDYSEFKTINRLVPDEVVSILGVIKSVSNSTRGKLQITECMLYDGTGFLRVTWFNHAWLIHQLHEGQAVVVSGKVDVYLGRPVMNNPEWEPSDQENLLTNRIVPIYALNQNLKQNFLRRMIFNTVRHWKGQLPEFLPDYVLESADLLPLQIAISQIHFPDNKEMLRRARERLSFDEIFLLQICVLLQKQKWVSVDGQICAVSDEISAQWLDNLPFKLTDAQLSVFADIRKDMASGKPMNRLVQGDVGSGKTIVASLASLLAVHEDGQAVIMAPTGVLAEQHYRNYLKFLESIGAENAGINPEQVALLTGSTPEAQKRAIRDGLADGTIHVVIGTHALIEDPVKYKKLTLAVIDEQHRFGVEQRAALRGKGVNPHLLVMTATPIPRTLSLTIYGDLDLSVIDQLPAGRQPIQTFVVPPLGRERVYKKIEEEVALGHQAFMIYPLVEEDDDEEKEGRAAVEAYERLQEKIFPDLRLALLHGRMKGEEKDAVLEAFKNHEYDILVSTSVIEVGVDVPNATMMVVEGANRFGLAQLHQFRGRVGRGTEKSWCILIPEKDGAVENERLKAMTETNDGFKLAEMDMVMRGPGDFIGKRQAGIRELKLASITDARLIEKARKEAEKVFESDPYIKAPENAELRSRIINMAEIRQRGEIS